MKVLAVLFSSFIDFPIKVQKFSSMHFINSSSSAILKKGMLASIQNVHIQSLFWQNRVLSLEIPGIQVTCWYNLHTVHSMDFECLCSCFAYLTQILDVLLLLLIDKIGVIELRAGFGVDCERADVVSSGGAGCGRRCWGQWYGVWALEGLLSLRVRTLSCHTHFLDTHLMNFKVQLCSFHTHSQDIHMIHSWHSYTYLCFLSFTQVSFSLKTWSCNTVLYLHIVFMNGMWSVLGCALVMLDLIKASIKRVKTVKGAVRICE